MELSDLQVLAKADETPAYAKTLAMAAHHRHEERQDNHRGQTHGQAIRQTAAKVDITTNGKQIQQGTPLTREEQIAYLKKLEEEY